MLAVIIASGYLVWHRSNSHAAAKVATQMTNTPAKPSGQIASKIAVKTPPAPNYCDGNSGQTIIVSIAKQHLWACDGATSRYDSAVITGMEIYPADLTPTGTYQIYAKSTGQTLAGNDSTGSWSDYVNYWMPFLDNRYGTYGFHDLTQTANGSNGRSDSDFGNVDINAPYTAAKHGSHGCVELPLTTAKWLYDWSSVGTTVTIQA